MTQAQTQDWVEKIKKLLAVAEDPNTPEAMAENYRERAYALMTQFEIEEAHLRDADRAKIENIVRQDWKDLDLGKTYSHELTVLIAHVADAHGMKGLIGKSYYGLDGKPVRAGRSYPVIIGFEGDCVRLRLLVESLLRQCTTALAKHMREWVRDNASSWYAPTPSQKYNQRRGFIIGYGERLEVRIREARRVTVEAADTGEPGTALVLADKAKQVESWWIENVSVRSGASRRYSDGTSAGWTAGGSADLGQTRMGGARGAIGR